MYTSNMITEEEKYKAYTLNIAGFAVMTPLGKVVLDNIQLFRNVGAKWFLINLIIALGLFGFGLTLIELGRTILHRYRRLKDDIK